MSIEESEPLAKRIRLHAVRMTSAASSSHVGSILSMADIIAVLYAGILRVDPDKPDWHGRDRFILSKGHAGAGVYAALAERGFFPVEELHTLCKDGSKLSGHISHRGVPGVEVSTGSLGHGLAVAVGMAYSGKLDGQSHRVFVLLSDGECDAGSTWEAALLAGHLELKNLVAIVDYNKIQSLDTVEYTVRLEPFAEKWRSFGWAVLEIDGHSHVDLWQSLVGGSGTTAGPLVVIAHTTKGKGVPFMEGNVLWHYRSPQGEELHKAIEALEK